MRLSILNCSYSALPYLKTLIFEWNRPKCAYSGKSHMTSTTFPIQKNCMAWNLPNLERVVLINYELDWEYMYFNMLGWTSNRWVPTLDLSRSLLSVPRVRSVYFSGVVRKLEQFVEEGRIILGHVHEY